MSTNTISDNQPVSAIAPQTELETSVTARRAELIAKLVQIKNDVSIEAAETRARLKTKLSQLGRIVKEGVVDGWASLGDAARGKLDHWLAESRLS